MQMLKKTFLSDTYRWIPEGTRNMFILLFTGLIYMSLYIYYKMHGAQEGFPKLTSRWLPEGTGNVFNLLFMIGSQGKLTLKRGTGRAALKTPFSRSLSCSLRPNSACFSSLRPLFNKKLQFFTKFAVIESKFQFQSLKFCKISVPKPQLGQNPVLQTPFFFSKKGNNSLSPYLLCLAMLGIYFFIFASCEPLIKNAFSPNCSMISPYTLRPLDQCDVVNTHFSNGVEKVSQI